MAGEALRLVLNATTVLCGGLVLGQGVTIVHLPQAGTTAVRACSAKIDITLNNLSLSTNDQVVSVETVIPQEELAALQKGIAFQCETRYCDTYSPDAGHPRPVVHRKYTTVATGLWALDEPELDITDQLLQDETVLRWDDQRRAYGVYITDSNKETEHLGAAKIPQFWIPDDDCAVLLPTRPMAIGTRWLVIGEDARQLVIADLCGPFARYLRDVAGSEVESSLSGPVVDCVLECVEETDSGRLAIVRFSYQVVSNVFMKDMLDALRVVDGSAVLSIELKSRGVLQWNITKNQLALMAAVIDGSLVVNMEGEADGQSHLGHCSVSMHGRISVCDEALSGRLNPAIEKLEKESATQESVMKGNPSPNGPVPPLVEPRRDLLALNSVEFIRLPAGQFWMGDNEGGQGEAPRHRVRISTPFEIGKYEVTQLQWSSVMGERPDTQAWPDCDDCAVSMVNWDDARAFCKRASELTGQSWRLPTEAEWEYACRAGSETRFCFGDDEKSLKEWAWYDEMSFRRTKDLLGRTIFERVENSNAHVQRVGQKKPNAWGLHDMHGNVWEWCSDWYEDGWYRQRGALVDPVGPATGVERVLRGGSCSYDASFCRSAARFQDLPGFSRHATFGFRVARSL